MPSSSTSGEEGRGAGVLQSLSGGNGRVDADPHAVPAPPFALFSSDNPAAGGGGGGSRWRENGCASIKNMEASPVARLFFSPTNMDALQQGLRYRVWVETKGGHTIGRQSETELLAVMRSIYFTHGRNEPYDIVAQVRELNGHVLDYCVRTVVSELELYTQYRRDIATLPVPLERGQLATTKGSRTLEVFGGANSRW